MMNLEKQQPVTIKESIQAGTKEEWFALCRELEAVLNGKEQVENVRVFVEDLIERALQFFSKSYQEELSNKMFDIKECSLTELKSFLLNLKAEVAQAGCDYLGF